MSDVLTREEFDQRLDILMSPLGDMLEQAEALSELIEHDSEQRERILKLEAKLAGFEHMGTGAGLGVPLAR